MTTAGRDDSEALVRIDGASVVRGNRTLLSDITIAIHPGELISIVGPNGGGKTTLLKLLIGTTRPSTGTVTRRAGLQVGYQPQRSVVAEHIPLSGNDLLRLAEKKADPQEIDRRLDALSLDKKTLDRQIAELSGGERQRLMIARAMLRHPDLLALDEPGTYSDQRNLAELYSCIEDYCRELGCATVVVSHDISRVLAHSDHVYCLNQAMVCEGGPDQVSADTEFEAMFNTNSHTGIYRHRH